MARPRQTSGDVKRNVLGRLGWYTAHRDDARVAQAVHQGEELDAVYKLDEAGLLDECYHVLEALGVLRLIEGRRLPGVERMLIPVVQCVLLSLLKTLYGIESRNALPPLLCSNVALMTLIGCNAYQVAHGFTRRGEDRRRTKAR